MVEGFGLYDRVSTNPSQLETMKACLHASHNEMTHSINKWKCNPKICIERLYEKHELGNITHKDLIIFSIWSTLILILDTHDTEHWLI